MNKELKEIKDYPGYFVNEFGEVYSNNKYNDLHKLAPQINHKGYIRYNLFKNSKGKMMLAHRLVADNFMTNPNNLPQINHMDGNKLNNHFSNLEWVTLSYNLKHSYKLGLADKKGEKHGQHKLNEEDVLKIRKEYELGIKKQKELADEYKLHNTTISSIIKRKRWKHI